MPVNSENQLKFDEGSTTEPLLIAKAGMEEFPFGTKYVVEIKPLITGEDHFLPSDGLINKMKEQNVDIGDKITIEKVPRSKEYEYGYFKVEVVEKTTQSNKEEVGKHSTGEIKSVEPMHKSDQKFINQFKQPKENNMELHELSIRVEKLEKKNDSLWIDYINRTSDAGHKVGDGELPY